MKKKEELLAMSLLYGGVLNRMRNEEPDESTKAYNRRKMNQSSLSKSGQLKRKSKNKRAKASRRKNRNK